MSVEKLKEFAEKLNGRQYLNELTKELEAYAKENGIVIVYGQSDDLMEVRGAIDEEFGCYDGGIFYLGFAKVEAVWCPKGTDYSWGYETDIPHETFTIMEDDEHYCKGIVFYLKEQKPKKTNFDRITENEEAFADWIFNSYTNVPENVPCTVENCETTNRIDCKKCFKEWLQKEAQ